MRINKLKVGFNEEALKKYETDLQTKKKAFSEAFDYVNKYVTGISPKDFYNGFKSSFLAEWNNNKQTEFPSGVQVEKALELVGFSMNKLEALETQFKRIEIDFNPITGESETPDFGIYLTEKEEIERYNSAMKIAEAVNSFKDYGQINFGNVCMGLGSKLRFDWATQSLQPNLGWVRNERHF